MSMSERSPTITAVRERVGAVLRAGAGNREVIVFALDGVGHEAAVAGWRRAEVELMRSVFPTTSSAAWLSSLTGAGVAAHGVPGVVFTIPGAGPEPRDVYDYTGPGLGPAGPGLFSDAAAIGYRPLSVPADLEEYPCSWLDHLLAHSVRLTGHRFFALGGGYRVPALADLDRRVRAAIRDARVAAAGAPMLLWLFVEVDRHIHRYGYDGYVERFLGVLDRLAAELAGAGAAVLAYADHGLVRTRHDPNLAGLLHRLGDRYGCRVGGAGRVRWLYPSPGSLDAVAAALARDLPDSVRVDDADAVFPPGSPARARIGDIVLTATGESFLAEPGYRFEHGSRTPGEVDVPFARWCP